MPGVPGVWASSSLVMSLSDVPRSNGETRIVY
jgi:hypothetical protein